MPEVNLPEEYYQANGYTKLSAGSGPHLGADANLSFDIVEKQEIISAQPVSAGGQLKCYQRTKITRSQFWVTKINRNKEVDKKNYKQLKMDGWFILTIWECAIKGKTRKPPEEVIAKTEHWLIYETRNKQISGFNKKYDKK